MKTFGVFICYKISSAKDFAEHLKAGLEELGIHSFLSSRDLPQKVDGKEEWTSIRDRALEECKTFILIITPGFELSSEVRNELSLARRLGNKEFVYFRHRDLGRKIIVDLDSERVDLGRQQQVSFETKEELLRLACNILLKNLYKGSSDKQQTSSTPGKPEGAKNSQIVTKEGSTLTCSMCSKQIHGKPHTETLDGKIYNFDSVDCARVYRKLKRLYGNYFE